MKRFTSFFLFTFPLIIYEITFALFVIYYIQRGSVWFKVSLFAMAISDLTVLMRVVAIFTRWDLFKNYDKSMPVLNLLINLLFFALYLFCILVQTDQWKELNSPSLFFICLLAVPPLTVFILFLYSDTNKHEILK